MVRAGTFQYMRSSVTPSLCRNSRVLTYRDRDGSDGHWQGASLEEVVNIAGCAIATLVATGLAVDVEIIPRDGLKKPGDVADHPACPSNNAPVAEFVIKCRNDVTM